jgi:hypothetical protein
VGLAAADGGWLPSRRPDRGVPGCGWVRGRECPDGYVVDWAGIELINRAPDPATITEVKLLPGFGSDEVLRSDGAFILGLDRAFGGGAHRAPSGKSWWGVDPEPAFGYQVPGTKLDRDGGGVELMLRVGNGAQSDAGIARVEVYYIWHGDKYKSVFTQALRICDAKPPKYRKPKQCRGEHPPLEPVDWPSSKWDDED